MKATIIYPRGMRLKKRKKKPDVGELKGADAEKVEIIVEETEEKE